MAGKMRAFSRTLIKLGFGSEVLGILIGVIGVLALLLTGRLSELTADAFVEVLGGVVLLGIALWVAFDAPRQAKRIHEANERERKELAETDERN